MDSQNEHFSLIDLLPQYRLLNSLYQQVVENLKLSYENQRCITDFYNEFNNKQAFEKAVMNILLSTEKEKSTPIVVNLKTELRKNIDAYTANKDFFDGINTINVCAKRHNPLHIEIEGQLKDTNKLWQELTRVRNSLESANWKNDKIATQRLTGEEERLESLYKKEQEKLQPLYQQQSESDKKASQYIKNLFEDVSELSSTFSFLLDNYFPIEKENIPATEPIIKREAQPKIEPEEIFRTKMFDKLLILEKKLIEDKCLTPELHWVSVHDNGKPDIKRLVTFLVGLLENRYFLPGRDPKIKTFFESRYRIAIGQNFEKSRREKIITDYKVIFIEYNF